MTYETGLVITGGVGMIISAIIYWISFIWYQRCSQQVDKVDDIWSVLGLVASAIGFLVSVLLSLVNLPMTLTGMTNYH